MLSDAETLQIILDEVTPLPAVSVPLDNALGRVLRHPARSDSDQPPFDRSAMDGFALAPHEPDDPARALQLIGEIAAGDLSTVRLRPGECMRVSTGAMIPMGATRVLKQEDAVVEGTVVRPLRASGGSHIRRRGEDARAGDELLPAGIVLEPAHLAILASIGITDPLVSRTVRVAHVVSGSELVHPLKVPQPGQIRDSNTALISALCAQLGVSVRYRAHAIDDQQQTLDLLSELPDRGYDVLIFSGGSGSGPHDFCRAAFAHLGFTTRAEGVAIRPGKPLLFGTRGLQLAFGLPGNPISHFVLFHLFVRPALRALQKASPEKRGMSGTLTGELTGAASHLKTYRPAHWFADAGGLKLEPLAWNGSGHLSALARTNALLVIPPGTETLRAGEHVSWLTV